MKPARLLLIATCALSLLFRFQPRALENYALLPLKHCSRALQSVRHQVPSGIDFFWGKYSTTAAGVGTRRRQSLQTTVRTFTGLHAMSCLHADLCE